MRTFLCVTLTILTCVCAFADGGFFPPVHGVASTSDQRAIVIDRGDAETIVLQTAYEGDASDFAWVIPVPELITASEAVGVAEARVFDTLHDLTVPRQMTWTSSSAVCGCSGSDDGAVVENGVTVWETLRVEDYEVAVLSAEASDNLAGWLNANGYGFPDGHESTLQYYLDRQSFFVAFKIAPAAEGRDDQNAGGGDAPPSLGDGAAEEMDPITLTFPTDELVFPMRISRVSTKGRVEVLIYVIGPHRAAGDNYATTEVEAPADYAGDDFQSAYNRWFEEAIENAGGKALVVEYAAPLPTWTADNSPLTDLLASGEEWFITRLRTRLSPEQMSEDIVLTAAATDERFEVVVDDGAVALRGKLAFGVLLLGIVQGVALRSTRGRRSAWATILCAVLIAII